MKKLTALWIALGPVVAWAQSGDAAGLSDAPRASTYLSAPGRYDSSLEQVRDRLGLTPEQQPLWLTYASKVDAYNGLYYREKPVLASQEDAAPRQIGRLVDTLQNRLAALEDIERAAKSLYASLSPEQQKTANQMLLSTVPTFASSAGGFSQPREEGRSKGGRADGGTRPRRSGGLGGGAF
jgi:hypothetical protein